MKKKSYSSYAEIDRELQILQLEREIHLEKIKLGLSTIKEDMRPMNMVKGYFGISKDSDSPAMSGIIKMALPFVTRFIKKKIRRS